LDYSYPLYDALISINVPNDKARAVVDAMERDMGTTIATKADLQVLRNESQAELQLLRQEMRAEFKLVRQEIAATVARLEGRMELLSRDMTVRLGSMQIVGLTLLFAALKLTG
jgi:hypothetical protein